MNHREVDSRIDVAKGMYIVGDCDLSFFDALVEGLLRGKSGSFWSIVDQVQGSKQ
jgi:hypothetical protein